MALLDDALKTGNIVTAVAVTAGVVLLKPVVLPTIGFLAKTVIKGGILITRTVAEGVNTLTENVTDMVVEANAEAEQEKEP